MRQELELYRSSNTSWLGELGKPPHGGETMQGQPMYILKEGTQREQGRNARSNNIQASRAIANAVRSTLGPRGMDKMLVDTMGDVVITNDGATILDEIDVQHPAAKMVIEVAETQDEACGDGTTTAVVLAGALLRHAEDLSEDVHATRITRGFRLAAQRAIEILHEEAFDIDDETLEHVARTAMASKASSDYANVLAPLVVDAVQAVAETTPHGESVDPDDIQIVTQQGGSVEETELVEGIILSKERVHSGMPESIQEARIALLDTPIEIRETEVDAQIQITDPNQLETFLDEEESQLRRIVDTIKEAGANVVFCQKGIDDLAQHFLAKEGIYAVRRVKKSDIQHLARATGASITSDVASLTEEDLGQSGWVEERRFGDDTFTFVTECPDARSVSLLVRGGTEHVTQEAERTLEDAIGATSVAFADGAILPGGGAPDIEVALRLREYAGKIGGREQLAIEAFADAIEVIPRTLAENAGHDAIETLVDLRSEHEKGRTTIGVDIEGRSVADMAEANVWDPLRVKAQALESATDVASLVLRIDDVIAAQGFGSDDEDGDDFDF